MLALITLLPAPIMTQSSLQRMSYLIIGMVLSDCAEQQMLLPAQWSIYSKQEVLLNLTFVLGGSDVTLTKQSVSSEPDDPMLGFMAFQKQLQVHWRRQSPAQLAQPAPTCPGHCYGPQCAHAPAATERSACLVM